MWPCWFADAEWDAEPVVLEVLEPSPASLDFLEEQVQTRSYPNVHGDVVVSADAVGVRQGVSVVYDPFGLPVSGGVPDNGAGRV